MDLTLTLHTSSPCNLVWADISGKSLGTLEAAASKELSLTAVPLATGLHVSKHHFILHAHILLFTGSLET